jgi:hypothetical protein
MTKTTQFLGCLMLFTCITLSPQQQERQYTTTIPVRLVNQYLMVINGQLDRITAKDYKELINTIETQIFTQDRRYQQEDSARAKTKKP